jgi:N-acetylmuramoyl-L-alanine amidase
MRRSLFISLSTIVLTGLSFMVFHPGKEDKVKVVVIDAGHGGHDPGCISGGVKEKDIALDIALKLGKYIEDSMKDVTVVYTRKTDKFVELHERSKIANKANADLFISIHCNANDNIHANGTETFVMGLHKSEGNLDVAKRENASIMYEEGYENNEQYGGFDPNSPIGHIIFSMYQNAFISKSLEMASFVEEEFQKKTKLKSRGVKQAGFLVLWRTSMPSVLVEAGFLTNAEERKYLSSETGKATVANSVFQALKTYKTKTEAQSSKHNH